MTLEVKKTPTSDFLKSQGEKDPDDAGRATDN